MFIERFLFVFNALGGEFCSDCTYYLSFIYFFNFYRFNRSMNHVHSCFNEVNIYNSNYRGNIARVLTDSLVLGCGLPECD